MPDTIDIYGAAPGTPEWWMRTLLYAIDQRRPAMQLWNDYYENRHPLNFFDEAIRERFGYRFRRFASNFSALVVDALAERVQVEGFRFTDPSGDDDVWAMWQENNLDAWSQSAHTDAFVKGCAYALVDPNGGNPRITVEDAMDAIVALDPRDTRIRLAGLKRWIEPSTGRLVVVVYLPDEVYKYRSVKAWPSITVEWLAPNVGLNADTVVNGPSPNSIPPLSPQQPAAFEVPAGGFEQYQMAGDDEWPLTNVLGVVPLVRLPNRPRLTGEFFDGRSEIQPISSNQDLINYYRAMAVVAGRYLAMPQRYALNLDTEIDVSTGQPKAPFKSGLADLWVVPPLDEDDPRSLNANNQVAFGQFASADLSPYMKLIEQEIAAMVAISRVPYYYLMGEPTAVPPSGESLQSSEAALIRKVKSARVFLGEGWEEVMRVALKAKGDARANELGAETIWIDPATRNIAVVTDAVIKQHADGLIDDDTAREVLGYSPQQRERIRAALPNWADMLTPDELKMVLDQLAAGLITADEARTMAKLPATQWPEGLSKDENDQLVENVKSNILTIDEARAKLGLGPMVYDETPTTAELLDQVKGGVITIDEARGIMGMEPMKWDDAMTIDEVNVLSAQITAGLLSIDEARTSLGRPAMQWPDDLAAKIEQASLLVRAGFDPEAVLKALDLPPIPHLGLPPVSVQKFADAEGGPETPIVADVLPKTDVGDASIANAPPNMPPNPDDQSNDMGDMAGQQEDNPAS